MSREELITALDVLAARWRDRPFLSNDEAEGREYGEVCAALLSNHGVKARIEAVGDPTDYRVLTDK